MALSHKLIGVGLVLVGLHFGTKRMGVRFNQISEAGNAAKAYLDMGTILSVVSRQIEDLGAPPNDLRPLVAQAIASRDGQSRGADPWGAPYRIQNEGFELQLASPGPDGVFDTPDDILRTKSWSPGRNL